MIWISGSSGFIGHHLKTKLSRHEKILCLSFSDKGPFFDKQQNEIKVKFNYQDESMIKNLFAEFGVPQSVIHLGWGRMEDPMSDYHLENNVYNSVYLMKNLFSLGLNKFIFIGSMNEYGSRVGSLNESMKPEGRLTNYALGKIKVANAGFELAKEKNKLFIHLRPFYVFGGKQREGSLINSLFYSFINKEKTILGPCDQFRDYIYVKDVVDGIVEAKSLSKSGTFNIGSGQFIQVKEFVKMFWKELGAPEHDLKFGKLERNLSEPDQFKSFADQSNFFQATGWKPRYDLKNGIQDTIKTLRNLKNKSNEE